MTPAISDPLGVLARQREHLDAVRRRIQKAYCVTVLDHITAQIRAACPEAAYVGFAYDGQARDVGLLGVLGEQTSPLSGLPWLWERGDEEHRLAELAAEIEADVQTALEPYDSPAWATVRRNSASEGNLWLVELPPPDRPTRIAELVREHHPEATAAVIDSHRAGGQIIEVVEGITDDGADNLVCPRWPRKSDETLNQMVAQLLALPARAQRQLVPADHDSGGRRLLLPLPPTS
ncbi:hypothetical protein ACIQVL_04930 [Streptomyces sp. NPDC090499]|uniref:hypothetical protein n=1 Tax=Streptomyces sp. NPDC090499 TaxID=3365965 RepID=UPI00382DDF76